jgi:hypothetical protein
MYFFFGGKRRKYSKLKISNKSCGCVQKTPIVEKTLKELVYVGISRGPFYLVTEFVTQQLCRAISKKEI